MEIKSEYDSLEGFVSCFFIHFFKLQTVVYYHRATYCVRFPYNFMQTTYLSMRRCACQLKCHITQSFLCLND